MIASSQLRLVLVTPETTLLDEPVDALRFPLFDGQIGILPGRAPLVGFLGYGELKITQGDIKRSYFIEGGFVQVKGSVVSILTERAVAVANISAPAAESELESALRRVPTTDAEYAAKLREQERARKMLALSRGPRS
jgi:F-type H+-transporting ATPase subunit epsilon